MNEADLKGMAKDWQDIGEYKNWCAEREADPAVKQLLEHGAACYLACAGDLNDFLIGEQLCTSVTN